jgi:hypothetical protein
MINEAPDDKSKEKIDKILNRSTPKSRLLSHPSI